MGMRLFEWSQLGIFSDKRKFKGVDVPKSYETLAQWIPKIGDIFPNFSARSTQGKLNFHDWAEDSWVMMFSHPSVGSAVSATEVAGLAAHRRDFEARGVKVIGVCRDSLEDQKWWDIELERLFGVSVTFPIVADADGVISTAIGAIHPKQGRDFSIRKTLIIAPNLQVKLIMEYPINVGRSIDEILRSIDALQIAEQHRLGMPADWEMGQPATVAPYIDNTQARAAHGDVQVISRAIRLVACPNGPPNDMVPPPPPQTIAETYRRGSHLAD